MFSLFAFTPRNLLRLGLILFFIVAAGNAFGVWSMSSFASSLPELCVVHAWTDLECPGCGMGRSLVSLSHLDVESSIAYHPFGLPLLLLGALIAVAPAPLPRFISRLSAASVVGLLGWWLFFRIL